MKKYDLSQIMKRAWELVKKLGMSISSGLKHSWREAKGMEITQEKLFEREQEIKARKKELVKILKNSEEWSVRRPSPEVAAEQEKLEKELQQIKEDRRNLPVLTYYIADSEARKVEKITVDNKKCRYSATIRAIAKAIGGSDDTALGYYQSGKAEAFETEAQAKNFIREKSREITEEDWQWWEEESRKANYVITYENY